jgi:hypothetical protein
MGREVCQAPSVYDRRISLWTLLGPPSAIDLSELGSNGRHERNGRLRARNSR